MRDTKQTQTEKKTLFPAVTCNLNTFGGGSKKDTPVWFINPRPYKLFGENIFFFNNDFKQY